MHFWFILGGLGLNALGAILIALGDAWLSRSVLLYLDALEASLSKVAGLLRSGGKDFIAPAIDARRDLGQDRARSIKLAGWGALIAGFVVQLIGAYLAMTASVPAR
jgi:hypothetical protein